MSKLPNQKTDNSTGDMSYEIIQACLESNEKRVLDLLSRDTSLVNARDSFHGYTPAHIAAAYGLTPIMQTLLSQPGIDLTIKDNGDRDALRVAISAGHQDVIDMIFKFLSDNSSKSKTALKVVPSPTGPA